MLLLYTNLIERAFFLQQNKIFNFIIMDIMKNIEIIIIKKKIHLNQAYIHHKLTCNVTVSTKISGCDNKQTG